MALVGYLVLACGGDSTSNESQFDAAITLYSDIITRSKRNERGPVAL